MHTKTMFPKTLRFNPDNGFLPAEDPLLQIPERSAFNIAINEIALNLSKLLAEKRLRAEVHALTYRFPNAERLNIEQSNMPEKNVAILFLSGIIQGYVWEDQQNPAKEIPPLLSLNILGLCNNRFPVLNYADYALNNFVRRDPEKGFNLNNMKTLINFTGTRDEEWFVLIHILVEVRCKKAIAAAFKIATQEHLTEKKLINLLDDISEAMQASREVLKQMIHGCKTDCFFYEIRPFLMGWDVVKQSPENPGIRMRGEYIDQLFQYGGASGAQSSILPAMDLTLGIKHNHNEILKKFQFYMPVEHREFLALLSKKNITHHITEQSSPTLRLALEQAVTNVALFRGEHLRFLNDYIFRYSKNNVDIKGTGSTSAKEFLGERFVTTMEYADSISVQAKL